MSKLLAQLPGGPGAGVGGGAGGGGSLDSVLGTVSPPPGVDKYNLATGSADGIGLLLFLSNAIKIGTVIAGIWVLLNFVIAGFDYVTAGDSKAHEKVREKLTNSILGLVIIVAAYVVIGIFGLILFGDATYFLNPRICGPGAVC